jgi:hypothetical protein
MVRFGTGRASVRAGDQSIGLLGEPEDISCASLWVLDPFGSDPRILVLQLSIGKRSDLVADRPNTSQRIRGGNLSIQWTNL